MGETHRRAGEDTAVTSQISGGPEEKEPAAIEPGVIAGVKEEHSSAATAPSLAAAASSQPAEEKSAKAGNSSGDQGAGRSNRPVADTSYLMPFGVQGHRKLLKELYPGAVAAPVIVRNELAGLAHRHKNNERGKAAQAMLSRGTPVVYEALHSRAQNLKTRLMDELHADAVSRGRATGPRPPKSAENAGEAECMCIAHATAQVLLCNDNGARRVARNNNIRTRTTAADLVTLVQNGTYTAIQMTQMARRMSDLDIGATISGPGYFRRPPR